MSPDGWPCSYNECRPGHFVYEGSLCLKSEYGDDGLCESGESFCRKDATVQPVAPTWEDYES